MARKMTKKQKKLYLVLTCIVAVFCLLAELGEYIGLPGWEALFTGARLAPPASTAKGILEVHCIDVGNADCILLRQGDSTMLIDAGERGDADEILSYLRTYSVERLDLVIATHPHADHIGSMADIIQEIEVGQFIMSFLPEEETPTTAIYLDMLEALDQKRVSVSEAVSGDTYDFGTAKVQILAPLHESADPNAMSVVTYVVFGDNRFLFTGDAEGDVEEDILLSGREIKADVLKVGHHGSRTGTHPLFLQKVSPAYAVIPCGKDNSYGHPHKEVLESLEKAGVAVYRTDVHGHIVFTSDGKHVTVKAQKEAA